LRATRSENSYRHEWRNGDVVVWDNRAVVHRATPYDGARYRRLMQRTTISMCDRLA
jgi:alpha-ketoglutarate-dependent 2,4-dichlorophenoxyacetate dioxygenase